MRNRKQIKLYILLFISVFVITLAMLTLSRLGYIPDINIIAMFVAFTVIVAVILLFADRKSRLPALPKDPAERLRVMLERYEESAYASNPQMLNDLSTKLYADGDTEKALQTVREAAAAFAMSKSKEYRLWGNLLSSELFRLNEVIYLNDLNRLDEAEALLDTFGDKISKKAGVQYNIHTARAKFAIGKGDAGTAREHIRIAGSLPLKVSPEIRANINSYLLLLEAECDFIGNDAAAALAKLGDVLSHSEWKPTIRQANKLKNSIAETGQPPEDI